jgi:hypothetical protein
MPLNNCKIETIEELKEPQLAYCAALQRQAERSRSTRLFHRRPHRFK